MIRFNDEIMKSIAAAVPGAIADMLRSTPMSPGKVEFAWNAAVGGALQRATAVHLQDGELMVDAVSSQWAREVSRSRPMILKRLQMLLGEKAVKRITVRTK
jgi:hypothetical protein